MYYRQTRGEATQNKFSTTGDPSYDQELKNENINGSKFLETSLLCLLNRAWTELRSIFHKLTKTSSPSVLIWALKQDRLESNIRRYRIRLSSHIKRTARIPIATLNNIVLYKKKLLSLMNISSEPHICKQ